MRLPPLPAESWDDDTRAAFRALLPAARRNPEGAGPAMSVLANHPELTEAFLGFSVYLLFRSSLPPRVRELAILRVAHRTDCAYEWQHHTGFAATAGLSEADIAAVQNGATATEFDQAVLDAADELLDESTLSDQTWAALSDQLSDRQRMDLVFTVGGYSLLAMAFNTFGVMPEHER
ncbi:carboxymuconolactone decarboxylase family protein [Nocardia sp. NPDC050712]|uniref:carboxymuconolactone decarboxylase family protein n=1 Tax=Nocardia sp. NPDC050712 TaxID=3155518 RepID=UPI0033D42195